jgi:hypothetical protein
LIWSTGNSRSQPEQWSEAILEIFSLASVIKKLQLLK